MARRKRQRSRRRYAGLASSVPEVFTPERAAAGLKQLYGGCEKASAVVHARAKKYSSHDARRGYWQAVGAVIDKGCRK